MTSEPEQIEQEQDLISLVQQGVAELRTLNKLMMNEDSFPLGLGTKPKVDQIYIYRAQGAKSFWYRIPNYPTNEVKEYLTENFIAGVITDIQFYPQNYNGKITSKVNLCFAYKGKRTWVQTATGSVTFRSMLQDFDVVTREMLADPLRLELEPSEDPKKPTVVFGRIVDRHGYFETRLQGKFSEIDWLPIETETFRKIKDANGSIIMPREEIDEACLTLLKELGLDGKQKLKDTWGRNSRKELNDGEAFAFVEHLRYLKENPQT